MKIEYKICASETEKIKVYQFRYTQCVNDFKYMLNLNQEFPSKDDYDDQAVIIYAKCNNEIIGTCRATHSVNGKWEITEHLPENIRLSFDEATTVQLDKVYIHEDYRNLNIHKHMFYHLTNWAIEKTKYQTYFAVCNLFLLRLYKRVGAELHMESGFNISSRSNNLYYIIAGSIKNTNLILKTNNY